MNYHQTLDYLYNTLPMFSRMGSAAFKKDLTNIRLLCEALDHPEKKFRTIHVGGTNGKGSVSHMLASVLQVSGYTTGLYTSPHLYDFRERIRVNGIMAEEDFVTSFVARIQPLIDQVQPSFFEITVAMAFQYFAEKKVDVAVIEVGLGGRLDSTNIIEPELSIITNIGWDHMNMLGDSLASIATEKAGIIKQERPVVIGEKHPQTEHVFRETASAKHAPLFFAEDHFTVKTHQWKDDLLEMELVNTDQQSSQRLKLDLPGIYQLKNICTLVMALEVLKSNEHFNKISTTSILEALVDVRSLTGLQGRWEKIRQQPDVILEVAHNVNGIASMLEHISTYSYQKLHIITGMVKDKDIGSILSLLPKNARYYFTQAHLPRALDAKDLQHSAAQVQLKGNIYEDVNDALTAAIQNAAKEDLVIVCGSIFLVAEVDRARFSIQ